MYGVVLQDCAVNGSTSTKAFAIEWLHTRLRPKFGAALSCLHYDGLVWAAFGLAATCAVISPLASPSPCRGKHDGGFHILHRTNHHAKRFHCPRPAATSPNQHHLPVKLPYFVADKACKYRACRALTEEQTIKAAAILLDKTIA